MPDRPRFSSFLIISILQNNILPNLHYLLNIKMEIMMIYYQNNWEWGSRYYYMRYPRDSGLIKKNHLDDIQNYMSSRVGVNLT